MKLVPLSDRVVLKQCEAEETTKSGIILTSSAQEKPQEAEVIAVGPGGMVDGKEVTMQVKTGQKVIYSKYAGTEVKMDGTDYIIVKQEDIKDEVFSTGVIGKTVGIVSNDGVCYSPVDGEVASVFQTKHAMAFKSKEGTEVLMHVGIDSVNLEGEGFKVFVEEGDTVKKGQKVLTYDKTVFEKNNIDETTIMAISNTQDYEDIQMLAKGEEIIAGDPIFATLAKED